MTSNHDPPDLLDELWPTHAPSPDFAARVLDACDRRERPARALKLLMLSIAAACVFLVPLMLPSLHASPAAPTATASVDPDLGFARD